MVGVILLGDYGLNETTMTIELNAKLRDHLGSGSSYRYRQDKMLPAVLYGKEIENKSILVPVLDVDAVFRTEKGVHSFINLKVDGDKDYTVLIKDVQGDKVTRQLKHVDFWNVEPTRKVEVNIETVLKGRPAGLLQGGILEHPHHKVKLVCEASKIPAELVIDVAPLKVNQNIHLADVDLPEGCEAPRNYNPVIAAVVQDKRAAEPAPGAEEAAPAEDAAADAPATEEKPAE